MNTANKFTKEQWIEKRTAEGFTKGCAIREYEGTQDPAVAKAQEQHIPTKGEMIQMIGEAMLNNPNRKKLYTPDFKLSKEYMAVKQELENAKKAGDWKKAEELSSQMLGIQISGTVTDEERQAEIDKTLTMPIASVLKERKKYEAIVVDCEEKLDNFDVSTIQAKVDALTADYDKKVKANAGNWGVQDKLNAEYNKAVDALELELITIPMNELALKRYKAKEYFLIYEARVKYYINDNRDLIEEEIQHAKRLEVRGSLVDLAEYVEAEEV